MKRIILVGGGHRAAFFLRVAKAFPQDYQVVAAFVRDAQKARRFEETWGVKTCATLEQALDVPADFAIVAVFAQHSAEYLKKLAAAGIPALCETPPALTLDELNELSALVDKGAKIQISEQYNYVPTHAARLNIVREGIIGPVSHAQVSVAHDYHGLSMLRHLLGVKFECARVTAVNLNGKLLDGPTRYNTYAPDGTKVNDTCQTLAIFDYGDKSGLYDFMGEQYGSWVRRQRVLVRGERGEIEDEVARVLLDSQTPVEMPLVRMDTHEYDYMYLRGYTLGERWIYENPYLPKLREGADTTYYGRVWDFESTFLRLTDDEIAVAQILRGMSEYLDTGKEVYSFAEGAQDQYMRLVINEALESGSSVTMRAQAWAR